MPGPLSYSATWAGGDIPRIFLAHCPIDMDGSMENFKEKFENLSHYEVHVWEDMSILIM